MALAGCMVGPVFAEDVSVAQKQDTVIFSVAGRPLIEYRSDPAAFKPYVLQMYSPAGRRCCETPRRIMCITMG
jgi:hypothetical protein